MLKRSNSFLNNFLKRLDINTQWVYYKQCKNCYNFRRVLKLVYRAASEAVG